MKAYYKDDVNGMMADIDQQMATKMLKSMWYWDPEVVSQLVL